MFVGSSTWRLWGDQLEKDFAEFRAVNRGFGGSTIPEILHVMHRIITPHKPMRILFFCGGNDIARGANSDETFDNFKTFLTKLWAESPHTDVFFVSVTGAPSRERFLEQTFRFNALVKEFAEQTSKLYYIDTFATLVGEDGKADEKYFLQDRLHLNREGQERWIPVITQALRDANAHKFPVTYGNKIHPRRLPPRKITIPNVGEYMVLKGDFHMHTLFSDGTVMPQDRVRDAIDNGLDVIAITDHIESYNRRLEHRSDDRNIGYNLAKVEADKLKLILVPGGEISKSEWHLNVLFINDLNPIAAVADDWTAMVAVAVEQGGFVSWTHPNWLDSTPDTAPFGLKRGEPMRFHDDIEAVRQKGHLHGIEVFSNSVCNYNPIAHDWCNEHDLAVQANTDIHPSESDRFGRQNPRRPTTLILASERTYDSVREAFFAKRTIGWAADMIFGRQPWVEQLFRACVEIKKTETGWTLRNQSDITCVIEAEGITSELSPRGSLEIGPVKKLTVTNWLIGTYRPLEITM
jgi:lysophospholipase L1-like esterase